MASGMDKVSYYFFSCFCLWERVGANNLVIIYYSFLIVAIMTMLLSRVRNSDTAPFLFKISLDRVDVRERKPVIMEHF